MFKFLRKYNKWILAVGGTLLMIVFLIPGAIQSLSQRAAQRSIVWATVGESNEEVRSDVMRQCANEIKLLQGLSAFFPSATQVVASVGAFENPAHWYLLTREAQEAGLIGGSPLAGVPTDQLETIANVTQARDLKTIDSALSKLDGINRMFVLYQSAPKISDARLRDAAAKLFHQVSIRVVPIEAKADADVPDPTDEELAAHFEKYKDVAPGEAERGFGYRLPDRFKIEWMKIASADIREMVESSDAVSGTALAKHYLRYKDERNFPDVGADEPIPDVVREDLIEQLVQRRRDEIKRFIEGEKQATLRSLDLDGGYYVLPDDWAEQRVEYQDLIETLQREFRGLPLPEYTAIGDRWLTLDDLNETELAGTRTRKFDPNQPTGIRRLINGMKAFGGDVMVMTQAGITGPPLENTQQDLLYYRVTDVDPSRPPHGVDEVREQLVTDLKRVKHYERLREQTDEIEALADEQGLLGVAMAYDTPVAQPGSAYIFDTALLRFMLNQNMQLSPRPSALPVVGPDRRTNERIIERALEFPRDTPLRDVPLAERTFVLPVDDQLCLLVVQLTGQTPLSNETFEMLLARNRLEPLVIGEEFDAAEYSVQDAFSYETLAKRNNFELKRRDDDEEEGEGEEPTATADASSAG